MKCFCRNERFFLHTSEEWDLLVICPYCKKEFMMGDYYPSGYAGSCKVLRPIFTELDGTYFEDEHNTDFQKEDWSEVKYKDLLKQAKDRIDNEDI